ncbi:hypothetical protein [Herpetosiphon giganteus]|uniref:hypothetical protein n=1 Tax=Herpetosiphon giganteus TaxID=2029754 RepID=UPI00195ADED9|nr:hypothetical protein [Herpetosiphon giganteus]MBM7843226.1 dipeptidyl aminopeptidase/acylaminoacyl peptidase [Herpetosiphon giganteus]
MRRWSLRVIAVMAMLSWLLRGVAAQQPQPNGLQQLNPETETVLTMELSSQFGRIVYVSGIKPGYNNQSLYSINADGTDRIKLNPALSSEDLRLDYAMNISADGKNVVYIARHSNDSQRQLYTVPITGGTPRLLSLNLPANSQITGFSRNPQFATLIYHVSSRNAQNMAVYSVYSVNLDGSNHQTLFENVHSVNGGYFASDGSAFLIEIQATNEADRIIYRVNPLTGAKVALDQYALNSSIYQYAQINQTHILYTTTFSETGHPAGLYAVAHTSVTPTLIFASNAMNSFYLGDTMAAFTADHRLHSVRLSDGLVTNLSSQYTDPEGQVRSFQITPDGQKVIYTYAATYTGFTGLWSIPSAGGTGIRLDNPHPDYPVDLRFFISPDSSRVVFVTNNLFSVPVDGSQPEVQINNYSYGRVNIPSIEITPDSSKVVYRAWSGNNMQHALLSTPIDGSARPLALNGLVPFVSGHPDFDALSGPVPFRISADSSFVVFRGGTVADGYRNLYATRISVEQARVYLPITSK